MLRIALAQVNFRVGDIVGNSKKILKWMEKAKKAHADLVAFPELAVSGYPPEDLLFKKHFLADCADAVTALAGRIKDITAVIGVPWGGKDVFNSAAVVGDGRIVCMCNKVHLPNYGVFDEKRYFKPARKVCVVNLNGVRIGVSVCEDIWSEDVPAVQAWEGRASVLLNISSSPYHVGKGSARAGLLAQRAVSNNAYVAYVNLVGGQDELVFDGQSMVVDPAGNLIAQASQFAEDMLIADIEDIPGREKSKVGWERRGQGLRVDTAEHKMKSRERRKAVTPRLEKPLQVLPEIYAALVMGTRDYVRKNGFRKVVVGLSGGIDSTLVAAIAADAVGKSNVVGISMPSRYSSEHSKSDAAAVARNLSIKHYTIDIEPVFKSYLTILAPMFKGASPDVTEENIQARIRGNILMALANKYDWIMLATGNKSELAVGYCTLYGDLAGGLAVLKDVPKTLVYHLARYRNGRRRKTFPESVFTKPPSAELRADQKDEDALPPYEVLDPVLGMYVEDDMSIDQIAREGFKKSLVVQVANLVDAAEYKRRQGPPGIKITPRAFGKDRRMPITNLYRVATRRGKKIV
jgi:NAD+ synthase (glutamine-hydrolysing)